MRFPVQKRDFPQLAPRASKHFFAGYREGAPSKTYEFCWWAGRNRTPESPRREPRECGPRIDNAISLSLRFGLRSIFFAGANTRMGQASVNRPSISEMFWPPKPKLLESTRWQGASRAALGM